LGHGVVFFPTSLRNFNNLLKILPYHLLTISRMLFELRDYGIDPSAPDRKIRHGGPLIHPSESHDGQQWQ
jgi:hypothetical protein